MNERTVRAVTAAALVLTACSARPQAGASTSDRNVLTHEQLAATNSGNLYDAIDKLRAAWLTSRGPTSISDPTPTMPSVYMNGQLLGKAGFLREVLVVDVTSVRFWSAGEAAARFGMGHPRGVIELTRR